MSNGFQTKTNEGRVTKLLEVLGHLETSARANRASGEEVAVLLGPVTAKIAELTGGAAPVGAPVSASVSAPAAASAGEGSETPAPAPARPMAQRGARWADVRAYVQDLDPHDLSEALALIAARIDDVVFEAHGSRFKAKPKAGGPTD